MVRNIPVTFPYYGTFRVGSKMQTFHFTEIYLKAVYAYSNECIHYLSIVNCIIKNQLCVLLIRYDVNTEDDPLHFQGKYSKGILVTLFHVSWDIFSSYGKYEDISLIKWIYEWNLRNFLLLKKIFHDFWKLLSFS